MFDQKAHWSVERNLAGDGWIRRRHIRGDVRGRVRSPGGIPSPGTGSRSITRRPCRKACSIPPRSSRWRVRPRSTPGAGATAPSTGPPECGPFTCRACARPRPYGALAPRRGPVALESPASRAQPQSDTQTATGPACSARRVISASCSCVTRKLVIVVPSVITFEDTSVNTGSEAIRAVGALRARARAVCRRDARGGRVCGDPGMLERRIWRGRAGEVADGLGVDRRWPHGPLPPCTFHVTHPLKGGMHGA